MKNQTWQGQHFIFTTLAVGQLSSCLIDPLRITQRPVIFLMLATANKAILIAGTQQLKERRQFEYITLDKIADFKLLHAADPVWGGNQKTGEKSQEL